MVPAGAILKRPDVQLVGIVEPDQALFDKYAKQFHLSPSLHFNTIAEMVATCASAGGAGVHGAERASAGGGGVRAGWA